MPSFRRYGASARSRARYASRSSRRWGPRRSGFVTARALLRYRSKRRFPAVLYKGPSKEVKYIDHARTYRLAYAAISGAQGRWYVQAGVNILQNRVNSIDTGTNAVQRIGSKIETLFVSVHAAFSGLMAYTSNILDDQSEPDIAKRTHFRWMIVEDLTMPQTSEGLVSFNTIYGTTLDPANSETNVNPLLADRNVDYIGRYNVLRTGVVVCDNSDPTKIVKLRIPYRRSMRFEGTESESSATHNVYFVAAAWVPNMTATPFAARNPMIETQMRMGFHDC